MVNGSRLSESSSGRDTPDAGFCAMKSFSTSQSAKLFTADRYLSIERGVRVGFLAVSLALMIAWNVAPGCLRLPREGYRSSASLHSLIWRLVIADTAVVAPI